MAQQIIKSVLNIQDINDNLWATMQQRAQIQIGNTVYSVFWHGASHRVLIQCGENYYFLSCPAINRLTIKDIIDSFQIPNASYQVTWSETGQLNGLLESYVDEVTVHSANIIIPQAG